MILVIITCLFAFAILCFILSFVIGGKRDESVKTAEKIESESKNIEKKSCDSSIDETMSLRVESSEISSEQFEEKRLYKSDAQLISERRENWLKVEQARKLVEQKQREKQEEELRSQEKLRLESIQKIKKALQWKVENNVYALKYVSVDGEMLYMDSSIEYGVISKGEIIDAVFRYGGSSDKVHDVTSPCRGVLSVCVEPFYQQTYEILPNTTILKVDCAEDSVAAYELKRENEQQALEKAAQDEAETRIALFKEEKEQRELQKEKREKERIRKCLLEQKKRRELEMKVHQEMYENGELSMDGTKRRYIPQSVVSEVYNRDGRKCVICGATENLQLDHIIPFSKGGADTVENLQILCQKCNLKKSNKI